MKVLVYLLYFGEQYYDPRQGVWTTTDPNNFVDGPNLYTYIHNSELAIKGENKGMLSRAYMKSPLVLREIIEFTKGQPDKFLPGATCWKVPGNYRGGSGTWELVADAEKKVVSHFNFVRDK